MFSRLANFIALSLVLTSAVHGAPLQKRIAQVIAESTAEWEQACLAAGGGQACNPLSITSFSALLAGADVCGQQDAADAQIDLAKTLDNDPEMIRLTQIYVQQPRNTPNSLATPYCQKAPTNAELDGLYQCQFEGANLQSFVGGLTLGDDGTVPFGLNAPLNPSGSCPANTAGPIADGAQLRTITEDPGAGSVGGNDGPANNEGAGTEAGNQAPPPQQAPPAGNGNGGFKTQNGIDAQDQNAEFETLDADSPCTAGEAACVEGGFAQCVGGAFVVQQCSGDLQCFALPLVNSPGTSITCTTAADAEARISASGATGGITGNGSAAPAPAPAPSSAPSAPAPPSASAPPSAPAPTPNGNAGGAAGGDFKTQNGLDAQDQNAEFETLDADSPCTVGEAACVDGGFAQCVGGSFVVSQCSGDLQCFALPLVNSPGTSITCTTAADAEARISASGATGGITGNGSATPAPAPAPAPVPAPVPAPKGNAGGAADGDFKAQNGRDAQRQNAEFATLNADSPCTAGQSACVDDGFAQCVNGSFVVQQCSGALQCFALPLVNAPGTSITCTTAADAQARIAASGA